MPERKHISCRTLLAAALREIGRIPYEDAKIMSEAQMISLFHVDHGILHAIEPINEHWNLTHRFIGDHREKTRRDVGTVAKSRRIESRWQDFTANVLTIRKRAKPPSRWPKRKFQARAK